MDNITNIHPFDRATALESLGDGIYAGATSLDYANIVGTFGGVTAATLMRAVVEHEECVGEPVAQTVNFCGALAEGDFEIEARVERTGKYTQHWSLNLRQDREVKATATTVCGIRSQVFSCAIASPPEAPPADRCEALATKGLVNWLERYSFRFVEGAPNLAGVPLAEQGNARSVLWIGDSPERSLDILAVSAIADCFFPRLLHLRGQMVPFGTVSMTTMFHANADEIGEQGTDQLLGVADAKYVHANFHDQDMQLWGRNGKLLASGSQLVWYKQ